MAKTIIQTIGPLYGEVVNGTVFGRPNGSVFVPAQNVIDLDIPSATQFVRYNSSQGIYYICNSAGSTPFGNTSLQAHAVAESQDLQNYIMFELSDSADFSDVAQAIQTAGAFNLRNVTVGSTDKDDPVFVIVAESSYYVRAVLMSASGVPVATSDAIELTGVVI